MRFMPVLRRLRYKIRWEWFPRTRTFFSRIREWYRFKFTDREMFVGGFLRVCDVDPNNVEMLSKPLIHSMIRTSRVNYLRYGRLISFGDFLVKRPSSLAHPCDYYSTVAWKGTSYRYPNKTDREGLLMLYVESEKKLIVDFHKSVAKVKDYLVA